MSQGGVHVAVMEVASVQPPKGLGASVPAESSQGRPSQGEAPQSQAPLCPACGSPAFHSLLSAPTAEGSRALVSCSRCGLLRFLGEPASSSRRRFIDLILRRCPSLPAPGRFLHFLGRAALSGPLRFLLNQDWKRRQPGLVLHASAVDGELAREFQRHQVHSILLSPSLPDAACAFHRHGVAAAVADPLEAPIRHRVLDAVVRLRGLAAEADPATWLCSASRQIRPGGRVYLQIYDCSSWAFLLCGSHWVGLEADNARYAYRAEDLEVLLDLCGMRIVRRSHYFPFWNALVWAASLAPSLDALPGNQNSSASPFTPRTIACLALALLLLPLAFVESLCHAGSVLMVEAELKS